MPSLPLSEKHRRDLVELTGLAQRDLARIWREFDSAFTARDGLRDVLPRLMEVYGSAAATLAADWYDELRDTLTVKGRFRAIPAELPGNDRTDALARWAVGPLFKPEPDFDAALALVSGGLQRIIANADRETIMGSSVADPRALGWQRVGAGECKTGFCDMLIGRGAVYTEATADFASHDNCKCSAVPAFGGHPRPVKPFTPSQRNISDADRARVRRWIAANQ